MTVWANSEVPLHFYGTGAAAARDGLNTGTFKVTADNPIVGRLDIGITEQHNHLGFVNASPHNYDQEGEPRVGHAQATSNAFRTNMFGNKKVYHQKTG